MKASDSGLASALALAEAGLPTFPCGNDKRPRVKWREAATADAATIRAWWHRWPDALPGVPTGAPSGLWFCDLDISPDGEPLGEQTAASLGSDPATHRYAIRTRRGGWHLPYRWRPDLPRNTAHRLPGLDTRGEGGFVIAWAATTLALAATDPDLPEPPPALLAALAPEPPPRTNGHDNTTIPGRYVAAAIDAECRAIATAREGARNSTLNRAAFALGQLVGAGALGRADAERHLVAAALTCGLDAREAQATVRSGLDAGQQQPRRIEPRTRSASARADASRARGRADRAKPAGGSDQAHAAAPATTPTEDRAALAFTDRYSGKLLFDHDSGRWLEWAGSHWAPCRTPRAFHYARELARRLSVDPKAREPSRAAFAAAVERFAQADPAHARHSGEFDRDPWILATPAGTVDLRTGALRSADPADAITQCTAVAPAATAECPRWRTFLHDATRGDQDLIDYLQRFAGYCLTGLTIEHILMFVYGPGGNGKTVFVTTLERSLGDYAVAAPPETFAATAHDRHPCDLAMLRGARLVVSSETDEGRAWAEARVKSLTGGDPITARFMRRDFFTFQPLFKLLIIGNHKPVLRNVDEAMRRRLHIVPFLHRPAEPDRQLGETLAAERPGILRWMIDGCLAWQSGGLAPPASVLAATAEYLQDQDAFGAWAAERLTFDPTLSERPGALLADFNAWSTRNGEPPRSRHALRGWLDRQPQLGRRVVRGRDYVSGAALKHTAHDD